MICSFSLCVVKLTTHSTGSRPWCVGRGPGTLALRVWRLRQSPRWGQTAGGKERMAHLKTAVTDSNRHFLMVIDCRDEMERVKGHLSGFAICPGVHICGTERNKSVCMLFFYL